jgi:hypothetical protein
MLGLLGGQRPCGALPRLPRRTLPPSWPSQSRRAAPCPCPIPHALQLAPSLPPPDILVATPGRLAAHLESTPGFSLASLRFLVVDETDRLLRQAYQGWLAKALAAMHRSPSRAAGHGGSGRLPSGGGSAGAGGEGGRAGVAAAAGLPEPRRVVKFVVSATLTRDPAKIDRLGLHCPRYIATSTGGRLPHAWLHAHSAVACVGVGCMQAFLSAKGGMCVPRRPEFLCAPACGTRLGWTQTPAAADLLGDGGHPTHTPPCAALVGCPARLLRSCRFNLLLPVLHPVPPVPAQTTTATSCPAACESSSWWWPRSASLPPWRRCCRRADGFASCGLGRGELDAGSAHAALFWEPRVPGCLAVPCRMPVPSLATRAGSVQLCVL